MEDWVHRALERWPNVPALFGWLKLDRRGRWLIRGEPITRPQIIDTINRNYAADEHGRWYFQNGPQRGYVELEVAPLILWAAPDGAHLTTHTGVEIGDAQQVLLDEEGSLVLATEHGAAAFADNDLEWALAHLRNSDGADCSEDDLVTALAQPSGTGTALVLELADASVPVERLDREQIPQALGFAPAPQPLDDERAVVGGADDV
ncbi:DUF2946 family protein [Solimonas marina]|uniref:DUF2946 family protein n=1 Tax=Solimonas marina TaxID=2714601 RepID=A0A969W7K5_9GAMM|nr:DUF2946 family protein [Solimonas marina]